MALTKKQEYVAVYNIIQLQDLSKDVQDTMSKYPNNAKVVVS